MCVLIGMVLLILVGMLECVMSVLRTEVIIVVFKRDRKYCFIEKTETMFIRTERGTWICSQCHFVSSYIDRDEIEGGDEENE